MIKRIGRDKWKHFFVGIPMGIFLQCFFLFIMNYSLPLASLISFVVAVVISYGFELYSLITGRGHYEILDAMASILGGLVGIGVMAPFG